MKKNRKAVLYSFRQYTAQIYQDAMLVLLMIAPVLCGLVFRFGIPLLESLIEERFGLNKLLTPYYALFDLLLGSLTPLLFGFASAYLILGEMDEGISRYCFVTPLGKNGYLFSRLGIPTLFSFVVSFLIISIFSLTELSFPIRTGIAMASALLGIFEALLVVSLAGNRVEGMALSKLSGIFFLGLPAPFFLEGNIQYLLCFLPSFWAARFVVTNSYVSLAAGIFLSIIWIWIFYRKFRNKIYQ